MHVEIVTPDKKVFDGDAEGVQVPGTGGSFEVLNNHSALISTLGAGKVRLKLGKEYKHFQISGGLVEVKSNKVIVLAESAVE